MERKFLEDLGLEKETVDKILDQNSADIGKHIKTIGALELERDGLKTQLSDAWKKVFLLLEHVIRRHWPD